MNTTVSVAEHFVGAKGGLIMSGIAFSIVFIIIVGLMLLMMALHMVCTAVQSKKTAENAQASGVKAPAQAAKAVAVSDRSEDDALLLAVITAAISAMCGSAARVVSFAPSFKKPKESNWKLMSRINNTQGIDD